MGWTHDFRDVARDQSGNGAAAPAGAQRALPRGVPGEFPGGDPYPHPPHPRGSHIGFPRILGRRARWVSARLRHPRR